MIGSVNKKDFLVKNYIENITSAVVTKMMTSPIKFET